MGFNRTDKKVIINERWVLLFSFVGKFYCGQSLKNVFRSLKLASLFDMDSLKDKFINVQDWIPLLRDEIIFMENDGKLEHRQCGEVQLGQETL